MKHYFMPLPEFYTHAQKKLNRYVKKASVQALPSIIFVNIIQSVSYNT